MRKINVSEFELKSKSIWKRVAKKGMLKAILEESIATGYTQTG